MGAEREERRRAQNARRRDAPDASGRLTGFRVEGRGSISVNDSTLHAYAYTVIHVVRVWLGLS